MKVEIVSCKFQNYWYSDKIGHIFEVEQHPFYSNFYRNEDHCVIVKEDCREVFEVIVPFEKIQEVIQSPSSINYYKYAGEKIYIQKSICRVFEKQEKEMKQEFTKSDLKNFMRVRYRDGCVRVYLDGRFYTNSICINHIDNYDENLLSLEKPDGDIVAVFGETSNRNLSIEFLGNLIWQRKQKSEQEIELEKLQEQIKALEKQAEKLKETLK